jgi:mannose-6-phosphate isomerase-like protein (cupin superfamily)
MVRRIFSTWLLRGCEAAEDGEGQFVLSLYCALRRLPIPVVDDRAAAGAPLPRLQSARGIDIMPRLIEHPTRVEAAGNKPKLIDEFVGVVNSGHASVSVARMTSPSGWLEPGQRPDFEEITVVLRGMLRVEHSDGALEVRAGQAVVTAPGEWVRYSTPEPEGAEYLAICLPAFTPATVHRD